MRCLLEEFQHAVFEHLVADREHVIAVRESAAPARRESAPPALSGEPATVVLGADRDQHRHADRRRLLARQLLPRAADAGGERAAVGLGLSAKARNVRPCGSVTSASDGASSASAMLSGRPTPSTRCMPSPPSTIGAHALRVLQRQECGDPRAHRIAHDVGAADAEMIHQRPHVLGHLVGVIVGRIVELARTGRGRGCRARSPGGPRRLSVETQPGLTQFTSLVEAKPCTSTIGSPSPSSR